jgi:hypothetical protein
MSFSAMATNSSRLAAAGLPQCRFPSLVSLPGSSSASRSSTLTSMPAYFVVRRIAMLRSSRTLPGKWVGQQSSRGRLTQPELRQIRLGRIQAAEMFQQEDAVIAQVAQRRNGDGEYRKAVVEIGAKATLADFLFQVAIGRGDDASR